MEIDYNTWDKDQLKLVMELNFIKTQKLKKELRDDDPTTERREFLEYVINENIKRYNLMKNALRRMK